MCQMSVVIENNGEQATIMENVTYLESSDDGVTVSTLFDEPKLVPAAFVKKIDFTGGKVFLAEVSGE